jgi:integrase
MPAIKQYSKKDGSKAYMYSLYVGTDPLTGKSKRTTRRGFTTKKEAALSLSRLQLEIEKNGSLVARDDTTLFKDVYLLWLEQYKNGVKENTLRQTKYLFRNYILPQLGDYRIDRIKVPHCQKAVNAWSEKIKIFKLIKNYASGIFEYAISLSICSDNPMSKIQIPIKKESLDDEDENNLKFYSKEELITFMACLEKEQNLKKISFFRLLAFTGARKSEVLALTWEDVDFVNKRLNINKTLAVGESGVIVNTPKTKASKRNISLDDRTLDILKEWRKEQRKLYFALGFNTSNKEQPVFTNKFNRYIWPNTVSTWSQYIVDKYELDSIKIHGFRHTHCSLLFESGASIQEVKERLGHAKIETTMNIYTHVTKKQAEATADRFAQYMNM